MNRKADFVAKELQLTYPAVGLRPSLNRAAQPGSRSSPGPSPLKDHHAVIETDAKGVPGHEVGRKGAAGVIGIQAVHKLFAQAEEALRLAQAAPKLFLAGGMQLRSF